MKKKTKTLLLCISIFVVAIVAGLGFLYLNWRKNSVGSGNVLGVVWYDEDGSDFTITTADELYEFADLSGHYDFKGQTIKLGADIVLNEGNYTEWKSDFLNTVWNPIEGFAGTFDGQGHTISGLYCVANGFSVFGKDVLWNPAGMFIDSTDDAVIRDFRIVNNVCGEKAGDQLLISVWDVLQDMTKPGELSAHINADQFVMYLNMNDENAIVDRLKMLTTELHTLVEVLNVPHVMPYFGICALKGYESLEQVYSRASQAKNRIKTRRDANYAFYDDKIFQQAIDNKNLEDGFENAIEYEEFEVWYQPKYDTMEGKIVGAEALVRWRKDGELIPPFRFIPLFESNGMIALLDEYVFRNVCRQQKQWQDEGRSLIPISVNISRASLFYSDIASRYEEILKSCNLSSEYVQLEITESATLENDDIASLMDKFHNTGFRLLLDDFGNGYSSLATLNTMNFDILQLDKSLIDYIGDYKGEVLLRHTIELAKNFGLNITAEGVETKEQVNFLQEVKCDDIQGYYFSKPLPKAEFERLMQSA